MLVLISSIKESIKNEIWKLRTLTTYEIKWLEFCQILYFMIDMQNWNHKSEVLAEIVKIYEYFGFNKNDI